MLDKWNIVPSIVLYDAYLLAWREWKNSGSPIDYDTGDLFSWYSNPELARALTFAKFTGIAFGLE